MYREHCDKLSGIRNIFVCALENEVVKGVECLDTNEVGEVADIIKDLAETEEKLMKACYYKTVVDAMHDKEADEDGEHWRRGYKMRYEPGMSEDFYVDEYFNNPDFKENMRMGYTEPHHIPRDMRYGKAYNEYKMSRKHYTASNSKVDKEEMEGHAREHMFDMITTIRDIWKDADPDYRKRMKADLQGLLGEMA